MEVMVVMQVLLVPTQVVVLVEVMAIKPGKYFYNVNIVDARVIPKINVTKLLVTPPDFKSKKKSLQYANHVELSQNIGQELRANTNQGK